MNYKDIIIKSKDGYELSARLFNCDNPKAVINCLHGMEEHKGRYDEFASYLQENGYAVLTCDMRGHGKNAPILSHIADKKGHKLLVQDVISLDEFLQKEYPGKDLYLFGHSMGTIIAREVLMSVSKVFKKCVLSGYPNPQGVAGVGVGLSSFISIFKGKKGHSKLLDGMVIGGFVKAVKDRKTVLDWLSYNEENVQKYIADPLCGVPFTIGSYNTLFHLVSDINKPKLYKNVNEDLKIFLISGVDDPCTGGEKGRQTSLKKLNKAGFKNIEVETINGMRHEILNENDKAHTYESILNFLNK